MKSFSKKLFLGTPVVLALSNNTALAQDENPFMFEDVSAARCYWLDNKLTGEGLCGEKMRPDIPYMEQEAKAGNILGAFRLGQLYSDGTWGVKKDPEKAIYWLTYSAERGFHAAQVRLAQAYEFGRNAEVDLEKALKWYQEAAERGIYPELEKRITAIEKKLGDSDNAAADP